jgi:rubrerythrin
MGFEKNKVSRVLGHQWESIDKDLNRAIEAMFSEEEEKKENFEIPVEENKEEKMKKIDSNLMDKRNKHIGSRRSLEGSYTESEMSSLTGKLLKEFDLFCFR